MKKTIFSNLIKELESKNEPDSEPHILLAQFLASVCSERYEPPTIVQVAKALDTHGLFLLFDVVVAINKRIVSQEEIDAALEWLESSGYTLQISAMEAELFEGFACATKGSSPIGLKKENESIARSSKDLLQLIGSLEITNKLLQDDITFLEGEVARLSGR